MPPLPSYISCFSCYCDKIPDILRGREERYGPSRLRSWEGSSVRWLVTSPPQSKTRRDECRCSAPSSLHFRTPLSLMVLPTFRIGLHPQLKSSRSTATGPLKDVFPWRLWIQFKLTMTINLIHSKQPMWFRSISSPETTALVSHLNHSQSIPDRLALCLRPCHNMPLFQNKAKIKPSVVSHFIPCCALQGST